MSISQSDLPLLEVKLGTANPSQIIINLLAASHPYIRYATHDMLVAAFLDMEADQEIRDTAQAVLEARSYIMANAPHDYQHRYHRANESPQRAGSD